LVFTALAKSAQLSNDGRRVAYTRGDWTRNRLVVASMDGSGKSAITDSSAGYFNMAWSPDDRRIAVTRIDSKRDLQVWVMNADGSEARALTRFAKADGSPQWPAWSPDGKTIAIQSNSHGPGSASIWLVDVATGKATNITPHSAPRLDETPSWFPDGKRIAFQSDRSGSMEIWTMGADGSDPKQLTR
jgi:TolB protein